NSYRPDTPATPVSTLTLLDALPILPGTGSNSTSEALRLTRWAAKAGADAALMVAPYYNKPMQEGFFQHFKTVADAVDLPICVYRSEEHTSELQSRVNLESRRLIEKK